jgi:hypothetical protein
MGISFMLVPLWYIPHVALQQVLSSIELGLDRRTGIAWAIMLVLGKVSVGVILCLQLG